MNRTPRWTTRPVRMRTARRLAGAAVAATAVAASLLGPSSRASDTSTAPPLRPDSTVAPSCEGGQPEWITQPPWGLYRLGVQDVWLRYTQGEGVTVAVVDSGVEARNPHLQGVIVPGTSFTDADIQPDGTTAIANHGTAVATIIAAQKVEPSQLVGVAPGAKVMPVRYYQSTSPEAVNSGNGPTPARLAAGIRWAADRGADIINVSSSQGYPDPALERAVAHAVARGSLVVASAGNDPNNEEVDGPRWPAAYPGVLGVSATTTGDQVTDFTVHSEVVDVAAPGQQVPVGMMALRDCLVAAGDAPPATSWATAYASGAAALVWAAHPDETAEQIGYRLMASADRPRSGDRDDRRGWGVISAYEAVTMTLDPARPGPPLPGAAPVVQEVTEQRVAQGTAATDPQEGAREAVVWWGLLGAAGLGLLLLLTRWNRLATGRAERSVL